MLNAAFHIDESTKVWNKIRSKLDFLRKSLGRCLSLSLTEKKLGNSKDLLNYEIYKFETFEPSSSTLNEMAEISSETFS